MNISVLTGVGLCLLLVGCESGEPREPTSAAQSHLECDDESSEGCSPSDPSTDLQQTDVPQKTDLCEVVPCPSREGYIKCVGSSVCFPDRIAGE